jgi:hypothetical protein
MKKTEMDEVSTFAMTPTRRDAGELEEPESPELESEPPENDPYQRHGRYATERARGSQ